jgi:predicted DNA-binding transcriptional regulator YafY
MKQKKFLRQLAMLQQVPRRPAKTTTSELKTKLAAKGFEVSQRTIQRDLKALSEILPGLTVDDEKDFPGWSWSRDTGLREIPAMNGHMALTFQLVSIFLQNIFPPSVINQLTPYFDRAEKVLATIDNHQYANWQEKVRILPRGQALLPAVIDEQIFATISEALLRGKQLRVRYLNRHGEEIGYDLHPLGLVFRDSVIYLVATIWDYQEPRQLALHRFRQCEQLNQDIQAPDNFKLDNYIAAGNFDYGETEDKTIKLKVIFSDRTGHHLLETPLSRDQKSVNLNDDQLLIEATVRDSAQLRWWLMGFGDCAEIVEPLELREEFIETARNLGEIYNITLETEPANKKICPSA